MGKTARLVDFFLLLLLTANVAAGRVLLGHDNHLELVSDGVDDFREKESSSFIAFKGMDSSEGCKQLYGFLPCSNTLLGHLFLIVVYEYLLFRGESLVASGGERIFKILGPGIFGASAFHVLGSLPEALILLASGLLNSRETAQEYVLTGAGLLAGSTILLLTIVWGTCVIVASQEFPNGKKRTSFASSSTSNRSQFKRLFSRSKGYGLTMDTRTSHTARIMVLSVIPFITIQVPVVFGLSSSGELAFIIISLLISVTFLLVYFFYQIFRPWIQRRRLEYIKHEHLVVDILNHVQNHEIGAVLTPKGAPNVTAIRRLFRNTDHDGDNFISVSELQELLKEIKFRNVELDKDEATAEMLRDFDMDADEKISIDEFVSGVTKWLDDTKQALGKRYLSKKSLKHLYQVLQPWIQKKREEREIMKHIVSEILEHVQSSALGTLLTEDGEPDIIAIKRLFDSIDEDKDNRISFSELKTLLTEINFGPTSLSVDDAVAKMMEELDTDGDRMLNEEEFATGLSKWLQKNDNASTNSKESEDENFQKSWEQTDQLLEVKSINKSLLAWTKAIFLLVLGTGMLGILAEPLIESVQNFSEAANMPSFFISFILVPLATNARIAISAISEARRKKPRTTSLTFSEIYGGVFMNNMLGFSVLLSLIYFRGLTWIFSAEVVIVLIVSAIVGLIATFSSIIPLWTSLVAYFLYPLSLVLVYLLHA
ncbi:sodium/calcium exchanger NCL2-like [Coffea arabica]|uniref:Sodium/calcium exchanger NCL2-like n=1 Tax=Coffea arabica TaxID=13443 RepID=A0A6P6S4S5_COFAR|nr:sodium/calcium exchanger NCL2-like [Coffea arabica]XP_027061164.1 sodium/calcium exchanger NCL2-like [Coffea arabica]